MNIEFEHINDYNIIIPESQQGDGIDFKVLINTHFDFPKNNDLILCLIEMVTIRDITAIGEAFLFSTLDEDESADYFCRYEKIIDKVIDKFKEQLSEYGVVGFKDWYGYKSFILAKTNDITYKSNISPDWIQSHKHSRTDGKSSDYGNIIDSKLEIPDIKSFLDYYAQLLEKELSFSNYPSYCIIVRPISVSKGSTIVPLGNLFLHFATKKEYPQKFYLELINKYLIVWFKNKGVDIIKEVYNNAKDEDGQIFQKNYLPKFSGRAKDRLKCIIKGNNNRTLEYYYDSFFSDSNNKDKFIQNCKKIAVVFLNTYTNPDTGRYIINELGKNNSFWTLSGIDLLKRNSNPNIFEEILLRREIFKLGFILLTKTPIEMLNFLKEGMFNNSHHTLKWNIWTQMFIPWKGDVYQLTKRNKHIQSIRNSFSPIEEQLFLYYQSLSTKTT